MYFTIIKRRFEINEGQGFGTGRLFAFTGLPPSPEVVNDSPTPERNTPASPPRSGAWPRATQEAGAVAHATCAGTSATHQALPGRGGELRSRAAEAAMCASRAPSSPRTLPHALKSPGLLEGDTALRAQQPEAGENDSKSPSSTRVSPESRGDLGPSSRLSTGEWKPLPPPAGSGHTELPLAPVVWELDQSRYIEGSGVKGHGQWPCDVKLADRRQEEYACI